MYYLLCAVLAVYLNQCHGKSIGQLMKNAKIIPWVYPFAPNETCRVSFPVYNMAAIPGGEIRVEEALKRAPKVRWNSRKDKIYSLIMISPDIWENNENYYIEWDPWVIANIPQRKIRKGNVVRRYDIQPHRRRNGTIYYAFFIFEQPEFLYEIEQAYLPLRTNFIMEHYVMQYNLSGPVAGNFFEMVYPEMTTMKYYGPRALLGSQLNTTRTTSKYWTKFKTRTETTANAYYYDSSEYESDNLEDSDIGKDSKGEKIYKTRITTPSTKFTFDV